MESSALMKFGEVVGQIRDPRFPNRSDHLLVDIVKITIRAVLCGADEFVAAASCAWEMRDWRAEFFKFLAGIRSHDTFGRVLGLLDWKQFSAALVNWTAALQTALRGRLVAMDGKTPRGSASKTKGVRALHLVSAWAVEWGLTLGLVAVNAKSNAITAILELLDLISIQGCTVTIDAMGMQKAIVDKIRKKKANYVIGLKTNQPTLGADMHTLLDEGCHTDFAGLVTDLHVTSETARGGT